MAEIRLSDEQRAAVEREGQDVCCVAGPGSGKTRVLVERFARLVERGADPEKILAITFTEKAATEIKSRVAERFKRDEDKRRAVERAVVSTIHGFCHGLLKDNALSAGLDPEFRVLDEREAEVERSAALETVLNRLASERTSEFLSLAEAWQESDVSGVLMGVSEKIRLFGGAREKLRNIRRFDETGPIGELVAEVHGILETSPPPNSDAKRREFDKMRAWLEGEDRGDVVEWLRSFEVSKQPFKAPNPVGARIDRARELVAEALKAAVGNLYFDERKLVRDILVEFEEEYSLRKRRAAALDFSDLEEYTLHALKTQRALRAQVQERFDAILMDELQDTNPIQWEIVNLIRRPRRFFAVGDVNQSIFGFRSAEPRLFREYETEVAKAGAVIDRLSRNYRSREEVLSAVEQVTGGGRCAGVEGLALRAEKAFPAAAGPFVEVTRAEGDAPEAMWVARRLRELYGTLMVGKPPHPAGFKDMVVLARTSAVFDALEAALAQYGIPCIVKRGKNFFEEQEVLDLTNWLRVVENPQNQVAMLGLLRSPLFGISDEDIFRERLKGGFAPLAAKERVEQARALREEIPVSVVLGREMDATGYLARLEPRQKANVEKFQRLLRQFETGAPGDLGGWIEAIDDLRATGQEPNAPLVEAGDAVEIMSVHSAKGLEFPVVAIVSMQRGAGGQEPSINWSDAEGLGIRWRVAGLDEAVSDPAHEANRKRGKNREELEEDRLLYVAMTRAEERLLLFWEDKPRGRSNWWRLAQAGLEIQWPEDVNQAVSDGALRVLRVAGDPEWMEKPELGDSGTRAKELSPLEIPREASSQIAVTSLARFAECPRRYMLANLAGWPQVSEESEAAAFGSEVHEALRGGAAGDAANELAERFRKSDLGKRAARAAVSGQEFDFLVEIDETLVRGQIDLWFEETGGTVIVDYKTDKRPDEGRRRQYEIQLGLYALALKKATGRLPKEAWLFYVRNGEAKAVTVDERLVERAREALQELTKAEQRGEFPERVGAWCRYCSYCGEVCPAGLTANRS